MEDAPANIDGAGPAPPSLHAPGPAWFARGWRPFALVAALGAFLYLPFLGSVGLWDPWEPHYAEVAREMVESGNWLEPTWEHSPEQPLENKYFFSKPALSMWLMAVPMAIIGPHAEDGGIRPGLEWALRLPFALLAIVGLLAVFALGRRFFGVAEGLLAAVILGTSPQYAFVARQAMTDMPLLSLMTSGMALLLLGSFDDGRPRRGLVYLGWAALGLAVLGKGLLGVIFPGLLFFLYLCLSGDWERLRTVRIVSGGLIMLLVAAPWYVYLSIVSAVRNLRDDEGKTFFARFFLHDHLYRLGSGVHGDRGTFAYFVEQLGLGTHPWFPFMIWGTAKSLARVEREPSSPSQRVELFLVLWALAGFALFSLSMTKFHHYALPVVPALSLLSAVWLCRAARKPEELGRMLMPLLLVLGVVLISRDIGLTPKAMVDLFVYNYTRDFPKDAAVPGQIGYAVIYGLLSLALAGLFFWSRDRLARYARAILSAGAILGAVWSGWYFFVAMGPHWSQRHLADTYFALRAPGEPIGAYLMNWRGETFYTRNEVVQLKNAGKLADFLAQHRGKRVFLLVEQGRLEKLKDQLNPEQRRSLRILDRSCNKFYLVSVENPAPSPPSPNRDPG